MLQNVEVTLVDKIIKNLDVAKTSGIYQIYARFLKDDVPRIIIHLANTIHLPIKL